MAAKLALCLAPHLEGSFKTLSHKYCLPVGIVQCPCTPKHSGRETKRSHGTHVMSNSLDAGPQKTVSNSILKVAPDHSFR